MKKSNGNEIFKKRCCNKHIISHQKTLKNKQTRKQMNNEQKCNNKSEKNSNNGTKMVTNIAKGNSEQTLNKPPKNMQNEIYQTKIEELINVTRNQRKNNK